MTRAYMKRLRLAQIVEDSGLASLPRKIPYGNPKSPRLPAIEPGDGHDLERLERDISDLEDKLSPELSQQLTTTIVRLCACILDQAAPDILARERRETLHSNSVPQLMQADAWYYGTSRWLVDPTIRVGDMVEATREWLIDEGFAPPGKKRIREWLAPIAPKEAKRPGRPRKK